MKKTKRILALLLTVVLVSSMLGACKPAGDKKITLTTVSMHGGTDPNAEVYQAINAKYMEENPNVTIQDDSASSDQQWKTKIAADFAVGSEPDVIQFFTDANASDVLAANKFVSIEEIRKVYPDYAKNVSESLLEKASAPDGTKYAVPTTSFWEGMFVNQDLFDKYSVKVPSNWTELKAAIETFNANGIVPIAVSLNVVPHYWVEFGMLYMAGPDEFTKIPGTAPADWAKGLDLIKELRDLGAFPVDTDSITNDQANELFQNKKAAMQVDGHWYLGGIPDQENTKVVPFPVPDGAKAPANSMIGGVSSGFYITKKAWDDPDKRDAAVKFVLAHTSDESITKYWGKNGGDTPLGNSGKAYAASASVMVAPTDARISQEAYTTLIGGIVGLSVGDIKSEDLINEALKINAK